MNLSVIYSTFTQKWTLSDLLNILNKHKTFIINNSNALQQTSSFLPKYKK